jgi:hypothetical protein
MFRNSWTHSSVLVQWNKDKEEGCKDEEEDEEYEEEEYEEEEDECLSSLWFKLLLLWFLKSINVTLVCHMLRKDDAVRVATVAATATVSGATTGRNSMMVMMNSTRKSTAT